MSVRGVVMPLYSVTCDAAGCDEEFRTATWFEHKGARREAAEEGWQVRPNGGKGSRSAPDLCPRCASEAAASASTGTAEVASLAANIKWADAEAAAR